MQYEAVTAAYIFSTAAVGYDQEMIAFWKKLWKLQITPKLQFFVWRFVSNACPTNLALFKRGYLQSPLCLRCQSEESLNLCIYSKRIWRMSSLGMMLVLLYHFNNGIWFEQGPDQYAPILSLMLFR